MSTVVLVCSAFFDYPEQISKALRAKGLGVHWINDRQSTSPAFKVALRLAPRSAAAMFRNQLQERIASAPIDDVSHVIVVKGEGLDRAAVEYLRARYPEAHFSLYMWDAFRNAPNALSTLDLYDYRGTFDPDDAERHGLKYRPLFAEPGEAQASAEYDWSFIGTIHSDRYRVLRDFHDATRSFTKSYVFGYFPAQFIETYYKLRYPDLKSNRMGNFSTKALPFDTARKIIGASRACLDIEHPAQTGLTMRTIETLLVGRKLITTNARIRETPLYDPSRISVIDRANPSVAREFFETPFAPLANEVRHHYSIGAWLDEVLGVSPVPG